MANIPIPMLIVDGACAAHNTISRTALQQPVPRNMEMLE